MKLSVLASGSSGNGYIIHNEDEAILVETGVRFTEVKKALDFNISKVKGCLISHLHNDHSGFIKSYLDVGIDCYSNAETFQSHKLSVLAHRAKIIKPEKPFMIGNFKIMAIDLYHDVPCFGFLINHLEMGNLLFATDTKMIPYEFPNLNQIMIECNYDDQILDESVLKGKIPAFVRNRIINSHLGFNYVKEFLNKADLTDVQNIILIHASSTNIDIKKAKEEIELLTKKNVFIAEKGLNVELNKEIF